MARNKFDVDEELNTKLNLKSLKRLGGYLANYKKDAIFSVIFMFANAFLELLPPYFTSIVIDDCLPTKDYTKLYIIVGVIVFAQFLIWLNTRQSSYFSNRMGQHVVHDMRYDLFSYMQKLPFSYFDSRPQGKISVRIVNYVNTIASAITHTLFNSLTNIFVLIVIICFMFAIDVRFTLICLAGIPIFGAALVILRKNHQRAWRMYSSKQSNLNAYLQESISGMKVTQSFAREGENSEIFSDLCSESKNKWMKAKYIELGIPAFVNVLSVVTVVLVYVIGVSRISGGVLRLGVLIAFAAYVSRFWTPIANLAASYNVIINCTAYLERIFEMMDEPLVVEDLEDAKPLPKINGEVEFKNVTFSYEEGLKNILENMSFKARPGESIALVGPTGAGKSTVINLLSRFYNVNSGEIDIDGHDIKHVTLNSLRSQMGVMLQDSFLFSGTIMDNIRYSKLDATDEEVIKAAKIVCAHDFIMGFPEGYNTYVNERGTSISAGQRQLIAFARTLLADPAILILDEATSSIDTETEIALQKGLQELLKGRTSFIIAHRLSTIKNSTKIMYISNGNIQECGTHDELMEKKGMYYELYEAQYKFLDKI